MFHLAGLPPGYARQRRLRGPRGQRPRHPQRAAGRRHRGCAAGRVRLLRVRLRAATACRSPRTTLGQPVTVFAASKLAARDLLPRLSRRPARWRLCCSATSRFTAPGRSRARTGPSSPPSSRRFGAARPALAGDGRGARTSSTSTTRWPPPLAAGQAAGASRPRHQRGLGPADHPRLEILGILNRLLRYRRRPASGPRAERAALIRAGRSRAGGASCWAGPRGSRWCAGLAHAVQFFSEADRARDEPLLGRGRVSMRNALTFDVEEYFHAEAFAGVLRPEEWPSLESRVVGSTERMLDVLDRDAAPGPPSSSWAGSRSGTRLVREIAALGHEIGCHGYGHRMIQQLTRPEFDAGRPARQEHARGRHRARRSSATGPRPSRSCGRPSGASTCCARQASATTRASSRSCTIATASPTRRGSPIGSRRQRRRARRVPHVDRDAARAAGAGGGRRLLPPPALRSDPAGAPADQRARDSRPWSTCIHGSWIPASRGCRWAH